MSFTRRFLVKPGKKVKLARHDPENTPGIRSKQDGLRALKKSCARLTELQQFLYAANRHALLIVLQAIDAGGKDGTIRHVMSGVNPQGCRVTSFKEPSAEELDHEFLWRIHRAVPNKGDIGIFNRSHYEDVLVVRVHNLVPKSVWSRRYEQINAFERLLADNRVVILKFFLHISKDEQKKRFEQRLKDPAKNWKFSPADVEERRHWDNYVRAYEDALSRCSTPWAPWFIIPSNRKWYRNLAVSQIIVEALEALDMKYPEPAFDLSKVVIK